MLKVWKIKQKLFSKKCVLRNFAKFTGKHLYQSLFLNKVAGLRPATLLKEALAQAFSCEFCEISKNTFSYRTLPGGASDAMQNLVYLREIVAVDNHDALSHFLWPLRTVFLNRRQSFQAY